MLFNKAAVFGDLHLGDKSDSPVHNQDCLDYIAWFCAEARKAKVDLIIFVGDWFDNRSRLRLDTISAGDQALQALREVAPVIMITGNHDMFLKNSRSIISISPYAEWEGVTVINECTVIDGVGFCPFLVGTEYLEVINMKAKYIFGHFELPKFLMNSSIEMPDHGGLNSENFIQTEMVFSGHFHQRQVKRNKKNVPVWYIGSPFGMDFNDVNDTKRGMMLLSWGGDPEFIDWEDGPLYQRFTTEEIVDILENGDIRTITRPKSILEIKDTMGLELEDISVVREELTNVVRETRILPGVNTPGLDMTTEVAEMDDKTLDEVVVEHLLQIDPRGTDINPERLARMFMGE